MSVPPSPIDRPPYEATAAWYDAIYAARGRACSREIEYLSRYWRMDHQTPASRRILDAGCGSGAHFDSLARHGRVTGVDRSASMLEIARQRPHDHLVQADLRQLDLDARFDAVVSLFGVCGYFDDQSDLSTALERLGAHVGPGGVLLVEPPLLEERFENPLEAFVETRLGDRLLSRATSASRTGRHLEITFEWRLRPLEGATGKSPDDQVIRERHRMLLLSSDAYIEAATSALAARFEVRIDPEGPAGRGLLVAISRDGVRGSD